MYLCIYIFTYVFIFYCKMELFHYFRFSVWLDRFEVYVNEEKSRTFLGLRVINGHSSLAAVVGKLDRILSTYNLPTFYQVSASMNL